VTCASKTTAAKKVLVFSGRNRCPVSVKAVIRFSHSSQRVVGSEGCHRTRSSNFGEEPTGAVVGFTVCNDLRASGKLQAECGEAKGRRGTDTQKTPNAQRPSQKSEGSIGKPQVPCLQCFCITMQVGKPANPRETPIIRLQRRQRAGGDRVARLTEARLQLLWEGLRGRRRFTETRYNQALCPCLASSHPSFPFVKESV
jgi:hypothetical protein